MDIQQLTLFDTAQIDKDNQKHQAMVAAAHLPGEIETAVAWHRKQIEEYDAAIRALDFPACREIEDEAEALAVKLNGGDPAFLAGDDAPGYVLTRRCAAAPGEIPLWGQAGDFIVTAAGVSVRVEFEGMLMGCAFAARAVHFDRPFISETGYRSFHSDQPEIQARVTTAEHVIATIERHVNDAKHGMAGKLVAIDPEYTVAPELRRALWEFQCALKPRLPPAAFAMFFSPRHTWKAEPIKHLVAILAKGTPADEVPGILYQRMTGTHLGGGPAARETLRDQIG